MAAGVLEWFGYVASMLIVVSMAMNSIVKFRWFNLIGALLFSVYGFMIGAIPVGILNGIIVVVDAYYLWMIYSRTEVFEILEINSESEYLIRFLNFHNEKIQKICPGFVYHPDMNSISFYILRNMSVAGLFLAHRDNETVLNVKLDFVLPEYKDFKNGKYVYFALRQRFIDLGFKSVIAEGNNSKYFKYLKKLGFSELQPGVYTKEL